MFEERLDDFPEVLLIDAIDFRRDAQFHARPFSDFDGLVETLFRRSASKKCEIFSALRTELIEITRQTVVDGALPIQPRQRLSLRIGNGDDWNRLELPVEGHEIG